MFVNTSSTICFVLQPLYMRHRLEKSFSTFFFGQFKATFCPLYYIGYFPFIYKTTMWLKMVEKTDIKYTGNFVYNIYDKISHKYAKERSEKLPIRFAQRFLANLCNNLSYILG